MTQALTREQHLDLYYYMQLNRQLEERMVRLFRQNKIVGGLYSASARKRSRSAPPTRWKNATGSRP